LRLRSNDQQDKRCSDSSFLMPATLNAERAGFAENFQ